MRRHHESIPKPGFSKEEEPGAAYVLTYLADIHYVRLEIDQALEKSERAEFSAAEVR